MPQRHVRIKHQRAYDKCMAKVQTLSNSASRSTHNNDIVEEIAGKTFLKPVCFRWCFEYYAVERVVDIGLEKINECQRQLKQALMTEADMSFLTSFLNVMKPIVWAMDFLQKEKDCFMGHLIPTIKELKIKLSHNNDRIMAPLTSVLLDGLSARFDNILSNQEYNLATMLIPKFRLSCVSDEERLQRREQLLTYVQNVQREVTPPTPTSLQAQEQLDANATMNNHNDCDNDEKPAYDLFDFLSNSENESASVIDQVNSYLTSKLTTVDMLTQYPAVAESFKKCNSTLPSSATVERLFSVASQILTKRRCRISDKNFDKLIFLHYALK